MQLSWFEVLFISSISSVDCNLDENPEPRFKFIANLFNSTKSGALLNQQVM